MNGKLQWVGLTFLLVSCPLFAQVPAAPTVPAVPAVPTDPTSSAATATPAAPTQNLWSFLCPSASQKAACKTALCNSAFGQLLGNSLMPASALTGGVIPSCCTNSNLNAGLAMPADSAAGAAARIQQDQAGVKKRMKDVRYLGTVDCNYWPEAKDALINALRADRSECVRYEAALALTRGCCCNNDVVKALTATVNCSNKDGHPRESSERVRGQALIALELCLANCPGVDDPEPIQELKKEPIKKKGLEDGGETLPQPSTTQVTKQNPYTEARKAVAKYSSAPMAPAARGNRNLLAILRDSGTPPASNNSRTQTATTSGSAEPTIDSEPRERMAATPVSRPGFLSSNVELMLPKLNSDSPQTRNWAIQQLCDPNNYGKFEVAKAIVEKACLDQDPSVRITAFRAMPKVGVPQDTVAAVAKRLQNDSDLRVREAIGQYLNSK